MLTVFHTADWHLGQSFCGFDRDYEHSCFLDWLLNQLQQHRPDALLVSGDVFDTINPSAVAQKRLYRFLARAHAALPQLQIVLTAGNHDAGARLEAPAAALDTLNISVVGTVAQTEDGDVDPEKFLIPLRDSAGTVQAIVLAVPFLRPADVPTLKNANAPYLDGIRELYRITTAAAVQLRQQYNPQAALIALGHCHLQDSQESRDSERRLVVGGAEAIGVDTFDSQVAYVALGHLHRCQQFDHGRVRYSGSPIPLSFAETHYEHQVLKVSFQNQSLMNVTSLAVPRAAMLLRIPATGAKVIDDVLNELGALEADSSLPPDQHPFLEVRILEDGPDPARRKRIEDALNEKSVRLASIKTERPQQTARSATECSIEADAERATIDPEEVFIDAYQERYGSSPDAAVRKAFHEILLQEAQNG